jgi:hypothetical protein
MLKRSEESAIDIFEDGSWVKDDSKADIKFGRQYTI